MSVNKKQGGLNEAVASLLLDAATLLEVANKYPSYQENIKSMAYNLRPSLMKIARKKLKEASRKAKGERLVMLTEKKRSGKKLDDNEAKFVEFMKIKEEEAKINAKN